MRGFPGRSIRPGVNENRPGGAFSWAAAGECLLALTRQPLRRAGQPKAAAPDSCIRVASAPGERSYVYGKPMPETGNCICRGRGRGRCRATTPGYRRVRAVVVAGPWCGGAWRDACVWAARAALIPRRPNAVEPGSSTSGRSESADPWRSGRGEGWADGEGADGEGQGGNSGLTEGRREKTE